MQNKGTAPTRAVFLYPINFKKSKLGIITVYWGWRIETDKNT